MAEKELQQISMNRLSEAVRAYGLQKALAQDVGLSDTELSRVLHEQAPKLIKVLSVLGLEIVDKDFVEALKKVVKNVI